MNKSLLRKSILTARTEYIKWITNPRMLIALMLVVVIRTLAIVPLLERAEKMGEPMNIFEPIIAVGNSGMLVMFMPAVFLVLMSDFPVIEANSLVYAARSGKKSWFWGQIFFMTSSILTYLCGLFVLVGICSASKSFIGLEWSESTRYYVFRFPEDIDSFAASLLPPNLYNQVPLGMTLFYTFSLLFLYLFSLMLIIMLFKLLQCRSVGIFAAFFVVACGVVTCAVKTDAMWAFPMANSIIWLHYTEILREPIYPIWASYLYFAVLIAILLIANRKLLNKINFENMEYA